MSSCMSLQKVQKRMTFAAMLLSIPVKGALELWVETAEDLPSHVQQPSTSYATRLVRVALQEVQFKDVGAIQAYPGLLPWLQKHLPGISTAMHGSISSQLEMITKRISILQSLTHSKTQPGNAQDSARIGTEFTLYTKVQALAWVFLLMVPVAALCEELAWSNKAKTGGAKAQRCLKQGQELISTLSRSLGHKVWELRGPVQIQMNRIGLSSLALDITEATQNPENWNHVGVAQQKLAIAAMVWLGLVSDIPYTPSDERFLVLSIDWQMLGMGLLPASMRGWGRPALINMLGRPTVRALVKECLQRETVQGVLRDFAVTAEELHSLHVPASEARWFLPVAQPAGTKPAPSSDSSTSSSQKVVDGSGCSAAAGTAGPSLASESADDMNDMKELLRMMYG